MSYISAHRPLALFWLSRLLGEGQGSIFDLGGHFGHFYYNFQNYCRFPDDLHWTVCDLSRTVNAGREWAKTDDVTQRLAFTEHNCDADGYDVLLVFGTLQYLDFALEDMLTGLRGKRTSLRGPREMARV